MLVCTLLGVRECVDWLLDDNASYCRGVCVCLFGWGGCVVCGTMLLRSCRSGVSWFALCAWRSFSRRGIACAHCSCSSWCTLWLEVIQLIISGNH